MLSGIWQLLLNPLHDFPEQRSLEGVSIPAGPHNLIPVRTTCALTAQHCGIHKTTSFYFVCNYCIPFLAFLLSVQFSAVSFHLKAVNIPTFSDARQKPKATGWGQATTQILPITSLLSLTTFSIPILIYRVYLLYPQALTHISSGANSGASILYPSFISL